MDNWRYEPCGADLKYVSANARLAFTDPDFTPFRLDDAIGVTLHPGIQDELDPRSRFFINRADPITGMLVERRINDLDPHVTAREIWDLNNVAFFPPFPADHVTSYHFDTGCSQSDLHLINSLASTALDFVAQTPTASSSGLMQVMWDEARRPRYWDGVTSATFTRLKQPKYLFDRPDYIDIGGGSLQIGANIDALNWPAATTGQFATFADFELQLTEMMTLYNRRWHSPSGQSYGDLVKNYAGYYSPAQPITVFP